MQKDILEAKSLETNTFFRGILSWFLLVTMFCALLTILFCTTTAFNKFLMLVWTLGVGIYSHHLFSSVKSLTLNRCFTLLVGYILLAFPIKAAISQVAGLDFIEANYAVRPKLFSISIGPAIVYTMGAIIAIFLILRFKKLLPSKKTLLQQGRLKFELFIVVIFLSLVVKYVAHYHLGWGIPNSPNRNEIPQITGATVMYCRLGIFHILNAVLAYSCLVKLKQHQKALTLCFSIAFVLLDLGIGSKYSLIYMLVSVAFTILLLKQRISISRRQTAIFVAFTLIVLALYPIAHSYRFARKKNPNASLTELIREAVSVSGEKAEHNLLIDATLRVTQRINGFQNHAAAIANSQSIRANWRDLISSAESSHRYTTAVTGINHDSNTYGITQSGMTALLFHRNLLKILLYSVVSNFLVIGICVVSGWKLCRNPSNLLGYGTSIGMFLVFYQFQGGNLMFVAKQLAVVLLTVYATNYLFSNQPLVRVKSV